MLQMSKYSLEKLSALSLQNKAVIFDLIMRTDFVLTESFAVLSAANANEAIFWTLRATEN